MVDIQYAQSVAQLTNNIISNSSWMTSRISVMVADIQSLWGVFCRLYNAPHNLMSQASVKWSLWILEKWMVWTSKLWSSSRICLTTLKRSELQLISLISSNWSQPTQYWSLLEPGWVNSNVNPNLMKTRKTMYILYLLNSVFHQKKPHSQRSIHCTYPNDSCQQSKCRMPEIKD